MEEKNELGDIILNKNSSQGGNKKVILAAATLGVILIIVVLLMNTLNSENEENLPQTNLPPKPKTVATNVKKEEPLFEDVEVLDEAKVPASPSGPNRMLYIAVGILLGGMVGVGLVLGFEFLDKDIKTGKDIESHLGLRLLGVIPEYDLEGVAEQL